MIGSLNNVSDLLAQRILQQNRMAMDQALYRMATGQRINRAADDPAGLIATTSLSATLAALQAETEVNQRASAIANTADAALGQVSDLLIQAKSLATANANDAGLSTEEKQANQLEIDSIVSSVDRIADTTSFNGHKLLDGTGVITSPVSKQNIGSSSSSDLGQIQVDGQNYTLSDVRSGKNLATTGSNSASASQSIDAAINQVATIRAQIDAYSKNTIQSNLSMIATSRDRMLTTISLRQDADMTVESTARTRAQILGQASIRLLAQSRTTRGSLLNLLA
ncbi:MAG TPA: flagellin [Tepidisphaeraceae bacterium]|nr:flagellin [Tepidisphaeraceae bacterium]